MECSIFFIGDLMKVYLDLLFILNFLLDFIILSAVNYILRRNVKQGRILLGSLIGTVTLLILFIKLSNLELLLYKLIISVVMIIGTFGYKDLNYFIKNLLYFYMVSMLLGGAVSFFDNQFGYSNKGLVFRKNSLSFSYFFVFILGIFLFVKYLRAFKLLKNNYSNYYRCEIFFNDRDYVSVNAFLDTGNKLKDPYSNKSIILLMKEFAKNIQTSPIYVPYNSLNNHGLLECYKVQKIVIDGKECDDFLVGVSEENFFMDGIECIINSKIMEGLK